MTSLARHQMCRSSKSERSIARLTTSSAMSGPSGSLENLWNVAEMRLAHDVLKYVQTDLSLTDVFMAIHARTGGRFSSFMWMAASGSKPMKLWNWANVRLTSSSLSRS